MSRILVVDDDDAVRSAVETILTLGGYDVVGADGGAGGVAALRAGGFDAVIVDLFMPGMDGLESMRAFREIAPDTPMIAMSGYMVRDAGPMSPDLLQVAGKLGAVATLQKPFRPKELLLVVESCLARQARPGPARQGSAA